MVMRTVLMFAVAGLVAYGSGAPDLIQARDKQDRPLLDKLVAEFRAAAEKQPNDAEAQYRYALAQSYAAEVAVEVHDKAQGKAHAETGPHFQAQDLRRSRGGLDEERDIIGRPPQGSSLRRPGRQGRHELDPKSSINYLSHGVGNYYLPPQFGGGVELAIKDFQKAISLDPKSADAYLWLGVALRKEKKNAEAHKALARSVELNPNRIWAKQQLDKTPAQ